MTDRRNQWDAEGARLAPASPLVASFDAELGQIFLRMRTLLGYTLWDMARAVGGEPTVIADLEAGSLGTLPPWPELTRLINAYAALTGVDASPIFNRILRSQGHFRHPAVSGGLQSGYGRTQGWDDQAQPLLRGPVYDHALLPARAPQRALPPPAARDITPPVPLTRATTVTARTVQTGPAQAAANAPAPAQAVAPAPPGATTTRTNRLKKSGLSMMRGIGRLVRRRVALIVLFLLLPVSLLLLARMTPRVLYAAVSPLPGVVRTPLRHGVDAIVALGAPVKNGLTWIDVGDPQIRKADKLPERGR